MKLLVVLSLLFALPSIVGAGEGDYRQPSYNEPKDPYMQWQYHPSTRSYSPSYLTPRYPSVQSQPRSEYGPSPIDLDGHRNGDVGRDNDDDRRGR